MLFFRIFDQDNLLFFLTFFFTPDTNPLVFCFFSKQFPHPGRDLNVSEEKTEGREEAVLAGGAWWWWWWWSKQVVSQLRRGCGGRVRSSVGTEGGQRGVGGLKREKPRVWRAFIAL